MGIIVIATDISAKLSKDTTSWINSSVAQSQELLSIQAWVEAVVPTAGVKATLAVPQTSRPDYSLP